MLEFLLTGESALLDTRERFPFPGQSLSGDSGGKDIMVQAVKVFRKTEVSLESRLIQSL